MKKVFIGTVTALFILSAVFLSGNLSPVQADMPALLEFNTMVGIPPAFTGTQNPIRGINGGGLPWMLTSAKGELKGDGSLELNVQGLVLAAGPNAGSNPISSFRVIVSCLTSNAGIDNEMSASFPATTGPATNGGGNAKIETTLSLPQPCLAPIVFVTSPAGAWFAVTGH